MSDIAGEPRDMITVIAQTSRLGLQESIALARELATAGFGLVADAVVIHVAHDTEAHARSFNEGYEAAIAQGLADDPSLAQDWLDAKLADAGAKALEDAAEEMGRLERIGDIPFRVSDEDEAAYATYVHHPDMRSWLRARAATVRGNHAHD